MSRGDAATLLGGLPDNAVHAVITSPPYGSLKDYGGNGQIGYGQEWDKEYLPALRVVLAEVHRITVTGGALWLVLDNVSKGNGKRAALPLQVAELAQSVGWRFQDMLVWDKGRTLPWSHHGRFRNVSEHVLLLSKGAKLRTFDLDAVRSNDALSPYWVRFPERYHPEGKAPSDIWHFPIPLQGSWQRDNGPRHFCPFPTGLVARMIRVSTRRDEIVLDPFAGTGAVPAVAGLLGRYGAGIELNREHVLAFEAATWTYHRQQIQNTEGGSSDLRKTIIELRLLKYSRTLYAELARAGLPKTLAGVRGFLVRSEIGGSARTNSLGSVRVTVVVGKRLSSFQELVARCLDRPPLSKFGLDAHVQTVGINDVDSEVRARPFWFAYRNGTFFSFSARHRSGVVLSELKAKAQEAARMPPIFADRGVRIERPVGD